MAFGKELKRLRESSGISVQQFADAIGISAEKIRKWEYRDANPKSADAESLEAFFKMPLKELVHETKFPNFQKVQKQNLLRESGKSYLSKDDLIKSLQETVESQKKIITFLEAENERLKTLYESDQHSLRPIKLLKKAATKAT